MADLDPQRPATPHPGVDAQSWLGFEQRIKHKRFDALVRSARDAICNGNAALAEHILEEAREISPHAVELPMLEAALEKLRPTVDPRVQWRRARRAVLWLAAGVLMVMALDLSRLAPNALRTLAPPPPQLLHALPTVPLYRAEGLAAATYSTAAVSLAPAEQDDGNEEEIDGSADGSVARAERPVEPLLRTTSLLSAPTPSSNAPGRLSAAEPDTQPLEDFERDFDVVPTASSAANVIDGGLSVVPFVGASAVSRPSEAAVEPTPSHQSRVAEVLRRYARAYGELDVDAAREIWPTVDQRALARAFNGLASQTVSFEDCQIDVTGASASASCRGKARYIGKVGHGEPRTEPRTWRFQLRLDGDMWTIATAEARADTH